MDCGPLHSSSNDGVNGLHLAARLHASSGLCEHPINALSWVRHSVTLPCPSERMRTSSDLPEVKNRPLRGRLVNKVGDLESRLRDILEKIRSSDPPVACTSPGESAHTVPFFPGAKSSHKGDTDQRRSKGAGSLEEWATTQVPISDVVPVPVVRSVGDDGDGPPSVLPG
jgi:hypothetical protein